jgi:hypothetical protein
VRRLRRLTEEECYLRCYGVDEASIRVVRLEPCRTHAHATRLRMTGEELRRLFEVRLDSRDPGLAA